MKRGKKHIALFAIILFQGLNLIPSILMAHPEEGHSLVLDHIATEGDYFYDTRDEADHADKAIARYKKMIEIDPNNDEAYWKLARSYHWRGVLSYSAEEKLASYRIAEDCANKAIALNPETIDGHLMLGISYGLMAEIKRSNASLSLVSPIRNEMNFVLKKDPENAIAHLVLGILYRKLPTFFGGSLKKSIQALKKALQANPYRTTPYLELARSYLKGGKREAARRSLEGLLAITIPSDRVQSRKDKIAAKALLASLI